MTAFGVVALFVLLLGLADLWERRELRRRASITADHDRSWDARTRRRRS